MKIINNYVFFYTNWLSNFHVSDFTDPASGIKFLTTEQAYMWYKASFFNDRESLNKLSVYGLHATVAKKYGSEVKNYNDDAWEFMRYKYMVYVNYLKYSQSEELKQKLIDTNEMILVEASPIDLTWGIGYDEKTSDSILIDESKWKGRNLLGKAIMEVRDLLQNTKLNLFDPKTINVPSVFFPNKINTEPSTYPLDWDFPIDNPPNFPLPPYPMYPYSPYYGPTCVPNTGMPPFSYPPQTICNTPPYTTVRLT